MSRWFVFVSPQAVKNNQCDEHKEEGQDGEEMTDADGEIARDTDIAVEKNEEEGNMLRRFVLEGTAKRREE